MTFSREKRLMLGWLALLAPLPLPFNEVLEWPVIFLYLVAVIYFLGRADDASSTWLDNRALNGLGLLYLPILGVDLWHGASRNQVVTPLLHLTLFVLVVKLFSVRQEKEKWHVLLATFFVFVAAMATSSNIAVMLYLFAALSLGLATLARLSELHMLAALGLTREKRATPPQRLAGLPRPRRNALFGLLAILLLAVPIFAALPRVAQPFLSAPGGANLSLSRVSGFSDEVSLDFSGVIRSERSIAFRIQYSYRVDSPEELRFKGIAYDVFRGNRWLRDNDLVAEIKQQEGRFELGEEAMIANAQIFLEPMQSNSLLVPSEAVNITFGKGPSRLYADAGGGLILPFSARRRETLEYVVGLAEKPNIHGFLGATPSDAAAGGTAALDTSSVTPRMAALAKQIMGEAGSEEEKILTLERFLLSQYAYTLDISDEGGDPIEDFLFVKKVGHCEYFATAMVLLLRSEGIPARFVTGFLGAEPNRLEDFHVVRQSNAHAWVEAYSPSRGWQVYDPTPPAGRPGIAQGGIGLWFRQAYEFVTFRWDRYVLTYGAEDQGTLRTRLKDFFADGWAKLKSWLSFREQEEEENTAPQLPPLTNAAESESAVATSSSGSWWTLLAVLVMASGAALLWRRRPRNATAAYLALRRMLEAADFGVTTATPPLELKAKMCQLVAGEELGIERLLQLYLGEAFADRRLTPAESDELQGLRKKLEKALKAGLRRRQKGPIIEVLA